MSREGSWGSERKVNLQISKSGDICQEKLVRQGDGKQFTELKIWKHMWREGSEAGKIK